MQWPTPTPIPLDFSQGAIDANAMINTAQMDAANYAFASQIVQANNMFEQTLAYDIVWTFIIMVIVIGGGMLIYQDAQDL